MRRQSLRSKTALVLLLTFSAPLASAQVAQLPEVVISANLFPVDTSRVGSAVTVLWGERLREMNVPTVAQALRAVPGMTINHSGSRGSVTEVRMRGAENNHLLVLIDGIEVNALANLAFDFADVPIDDVERIEVIRGPQSGIYGSNAHAGVISIITRSGKGFKGPRLDTRMEGGMLGTRSGSVSLRSAVGPVYGAVSTSGYRSDGYNISHFGSEKDGSSANSASGKFGIDLTDNLNVEAVVRYSRRSADGDPQDFTGGSPTYGLLLDGDQRTDHEGLAARVGATLKLFDSRWIQSINAKIFDETLTSFSGGAFSSSLGGKRHAYDYKSTVKFATNVAGGERHTFSVLADRRTENYSASFLGGSTFEKSRLGLAAEYLVDLSTFTALSGAIRHDWNEPFENALSWRLALSQQFPSTASRLHASMGKGITDPDHTEILGYPAFFILPNPNLKPESSLGWDVGLEQKWWNGLIVTDVTYFDTRFRDKIEASFVGFNTLYVNAGGISKRRGVEVSATLNPTDRVSITAAYTFTHARNSLNVPELRRPEHSGSIETSFLSADRRGRATIGASYNGERRDIRFNEFPAPNSFVIMPDTTIFWASLSYDVTQNANVFVRAENLFNKRYEEIFSFRAQPLAVFAGMRVKLGAE